MSVGLIELMLGIYFIGIGISFVKVGANQSSTVDIFKVLLGVILVLLALSKGVAF